MIAQSILCELDMIQMGNLDCANIMLNYRHSAQLRLYIIECLLCEYPEVNKNIVEFLFEQAKELIVMIIQNNC